MDPLRCLAHRIRTILTRKLLFPFHRVIRERTILDADSGVSERGDHAGGRGEGSGLGPGLPVRRLGLRGLPDVSGAVLVASRAHGAARAEPQGAEFCFLTIWTRLVERMYRTIWASGIEEGTALRPDYSRGVAPRSHTFPEPPVPPTEVIIVRPYDDGPTERLREMGVPLISLPDLRWKRCDIKSTNLLANVLAIETAQRGGGL